jgi:hypothetical protein
MRPIQTEIGEIGEISGFASPFPSRAGFLIPDRSEAESVSKMRNHLLHRFHRFAIPVAIPFGSVVFAGPPT